ncbi:hypothetical protein [Nocardia africana]|uniref:Beta-xylosidase n=1 Tax=Nocardia africana TaxID=134964 RepID=A0A378WMU4_9NOCA|nr:hypothetical protein [Nocardia africana]MCC3315769.1 hypothetical protein [Nocardia africana]SUA41915.1 Beta-xylosidase [Nocardia africana]
MRGKGVQYDTGTFPDGNSTRYAFDPRIVEREMRIIADDLHCTAVRVTGGDPERLSVAAEYAVAAGLDVWYSPFPCEMTEAEMLPYFADCADRAEVLRRAGATVVLATGCELSLFASGYLPGQTFSDRMQAMRAAPEARAAALAEIPDRVNGFLAEVVEAVRPRFAGPISYASIPIEQIDWRPFDIVGVDAYRNSHNALTYRRQLGQYFSYGKPVVVTEVGCCTFRGAADLGAGGWTVIEPDGRVRPGTVRDESEQVRYMNDLLPVFAQEGIDTVFWFSFAGFELPHRPDPRSDLDLGSYGIVKMLDDGAPAHTYPGMPWEPKEAFHALAEHYR